MTRVSRGPGISVHDYASALKAHDAAYVCDKCVERKLRGYRPEVLSDPNYETTEDVDGD